jgi:aminopeptidase N
MVDKADEFADMEAMIDAAESMLGPYRWEHGVLVLPPSFPYGGMENPRLTFATPTILAGDRSLVSLIAHELAHSWSGNLVTNATWNDFWLNEGFTTYSSAAWTRCLRIHGMQAILGSATSTSISKSTVPTPGLRAVVDLSVRRGKVSTAAA